MVRMYHHPVVAPLVLRVLFVGQLHRRVLSLAPSRDPEVLFPCDYELLRHEFSYAPLRSVLYLYQPRLRIRRLRVIS